MVRVLKNMRSRLIDDGQMTEEVAPSYFIEGLLYNVPDDQFEGDLGECFCNCVNWLLDADRSEFVCPSWKHWLFGDSSVQWERSRCDQFLNALVDLWNRY